MKLLAFSNPLVQPYSFQTDKPVPKIVHYCWYGGKRRPTFRFYHYISILSADKFIKPEVIYFWHDEIPQGDLWEEIRRRVPSIQMMYRPAPTHIYYRSIVVDQHQSDIVRLEAVMEYGGIYMDLDVVVLKSFDPLLKYDTTMGYERTDGLCNGIIISKPNAPFLRLWHLEYSNFVDNSWAYHSVELPAVLARTYPGLIHTEERTLHRPNWDESEWMYGKGKLYNWSNNYAVHLYYNSGQRWIEYSPETIKKINTTMGQIFRYIYYGSKDFVND
jgi:mannosyltransferase OCH1-like enzyme